MTKDQLRALAESWEAKIQIAYNDYSYGQRVAYEDAARDLLELVDRVAAEPSELQDARDDLTVAREFIRRCVGAVGRDPKVQTVDLLELADHVAGIIERAHSK